MSLNSNFGLPVVVVGAGMSGLTALKSCLEEGLPAVCLEKADCIGGIWKFRESGMSCMKTTVLNVSKECTCFSDFPVPHHFPNYLNHAYYLEYLNMYADQFNLKQHIKLEHEVTEIAAAENAEETGQWVVSSKNLITGVESSILALGVLVCTGVYRDPYIPPIPGLNEFKGMVLHSRDYKAPQSFDDKTVLVVGSGNSAFDIAVDVGRVSRQLYSSSNRDTLILSRISNKGQPIDTLSLSRFNFLLSLYVSESTVAKFMSSLGCQNIDRELYNMDFDDFHLQKDIPVFNDELAFSVLNGRVIMKNPVHHFTAKGVAFKGEEDTTYPIDVVVMATGYRLPDFAVINSKDVSVVDIQRRLYKRVFPVNMKHPTLAFIGYTKFGGPMAILSELQGRWAAQVFAKIMKLPEKDAMLKDLKEREKALLQYKVGQNNLGVTCVYPYLEEVASICRVRPNLWRLLFTEPRLFYACFFGPYLPYHFRLNGPHPWDGARRAIFTVQDRVRAPFDTRPPLQSPAKQRSKKMYAFATFCLAALGLAVMAVKVQDIVTYY